MGYHTAANHAHHNTNTYYDTATENRFGRLLGGVAYDHGDFPKIVSVHWLAKRPEESKTREATADSHCNPRTEAKNSFEHVTVAETSTNHSISTILDLSSSSPVQDIGSIKPLSEVVSTTTNARISLDSDEDEIGKESEYISTEEDIIKVSCVCPSSSTMYICCKFLKKRNGRKRVKPTSIQGALSSPSLQQGGRGGGGESLGWRSVYLLVS